jgi:hypothetical protein
MQQEEEGRGKETQSLQIGNEKRRKRRIKENLYL